MTSSAPVWPLRFTHRGPVLGRGFVALVEFSGRLLARPESEGVWIEGVNPGAFAVGAPTLALAGPAIRDSLQAVFYDFAQQATTFEEFRAAIERYFRETDDVSVGEWTRAVADVRSGRIVGVPADLPEESADGDVSVHVRYKPLNEITPEDNPMPTPVLHAAA